MQVENILFMYKMYGLFSVVVTVGFIWFLWKWLGPEVKKADEYLKETAKLEKRRKELEIKKLEKELDDMDT